MQKPIIVITPRTMEMEKPFGGHYICTNDYNTRAVREAGGLPVLPPLLNEEEALELVARADGVFMSGGADVDPALYGEAKLEACETIQPERDASDLAILKAALRLKKPIICICRGTQITNVYFGGSLYQDLGTQCPGSLRHAAEEGDEYGRAVHRVTVVEGTPLSRLFPVREMGVNSLHHQAVNRLGEGLQAMAYSEDGFLEGWYYPGEDQWIRAYQWHPEMLEDPAQRSLIFGEFIEACRKKREETGAASQE